MTRIPSHSIADAPEATRSLLAEMLQFSPTGRLLNMHAQMAHAPAVLEAYVSIRRATARHGTLEGSVRSALMLAAAVRDDSEYALAVISMLALRSGWHRDQVEAILAGRDLGEEKIDALIGVVREAAANSGHVSDLAWARAAGSGWSDEQLAEAFAYLGLTVFTSYFLNYAGTELDIPAGAPGSGPADADPADVGPSYGGTARFAAALPTCRSSARSSWWPASAPSWFRASAHASP